MADEVEQRAEQLGGGALERVDQRLGAVDVRGDGLADHGLEELLLALEVQVDGPLAHPGDGGDVLQAGRGEAPVGEELQRRRDNLRRPRLLSALPALRTPCLPI